ncbi:MAG: ACT domain-containing protein [Oscillospiraceae bacterium]|nr:ACT domain-containing protein [Oscillospiraceae bacterium]
MQLKTLDAALTVCKVASFQDIDTTDGLFFIGQTDEELSLVCWTERTPAHTLAREDGWRGFRIEGELDFSLIGILSKITAVLAEERIGVFAVSTYNTDYILVKAERFSDALAALERAGYDIQNDDKE